MRFFSLVFTFLLLAQHSFAESYDSCILTQMAVAQNETSVLNIRKQCQESIKESQEEGVETGAITKRFLAERQSQWNRHSITSHKQNYMLPYSYNNKLTRRTYAADPDFSEEIKHYEVKFQLSIKVPLTYEPIFTESDGIFAGFSIQSWWQFYAGDISAPFRETNYQPEVFYLTGTNWHPFGGSVGWMLGIEHQSNGKSLPLSRSWNRVYTSALFEKDNFAISLRPWYRLKEDKKDDPSKSKGDDNPDIEKFMGHFELHSAYRWDDHEFSFMARNNLRSDNKGAVELGWSFPLMRHIKGYVQYFNGYGESLVDYNQSTERLGFGILLTDLL